MVIPRVPPYDHDVDELFGNAGGTLRMTDTDIVRYWGGTLKADFTEYREDLERLL